MIRLFPANSHSGSARFGSTRPAKVLVKRNHLSCTRLDVETSTTRMRLIGSFMKRICFRRFQTVAAKPRSLHFRKVAKHMRCSFHQPIRRAVSHAPPPMLSIAIRSFSDNCVESTHVIDIVSVSSISRILPAEVCAVQANRNLPIQTSRSELSRSSSRGVRESVRDCGEPTASPVIRFAHR